MSPQMPNDPQVNKEKVSLNNGYWFYLTDTDPRIVAFGSALTGRETVFVNDEIVSSIRSFGRKSLHRFTYEGHQYEVAFNMESILTGKLMCSLTRDGLLLTETSKSYAAKPFSTKKFFIAMGLGALIGFCIGQMLFSNHGVDVLSLWK